MISAHDLAIAIGGYFGIGEGRSTSFWKACVARDLASADPAAAATPRLAVALVLANAAPMPPMDAAKAARDALRLRLVQFEVLDLGEGEAHMRGVPLAKPMESFGDVLDGIVRNFREGIKRGKNFEPVIVGYGSLCGSGFAVIQNAWRNDGDEGRMRRVEAIFRDGPLATDPVHEVLSHWRCDVAERALQLAAAALGPLDASASDSPDKERFAPALGVAFGLPLYLLGPLAALDGSQGLLVAGSEKHAQINDCETRS